MERILPARVHNKFELELTDAKTGEVKQSVTCYNIILNSFFNRLVNRNSKLGYILLSRGPRCSRRCAISPPQPWRR